MRFCVNQKYKLIKPTEEGCGYGPLLEPMQICQFISGLKWKMNRKSSDMCRTYLVNMGNVMNLRGGVINT